MTLDLLDNASRGNSLQLSQVFICVDVSCGTPSSRGEL